MDFFEAVKRRRSIRRFKPEPFPDELVHKALEAAVLAPNSSNTQIWDFHWPKNPELKAQIVKDCFSQSAARTASHLIVVTTDRRLWKRSRPHLIEWVKQASAPKSVVLYYEKLIPASYTMGPFSILAPFKFLFTFLGGLFRPVPRGPYTISEMNLVAAKSTALACENFVLAISALGGATCMMEGFDEWRVRRHLKLPRTTRVVMVIGVGYEADKGTWAPQYRLPLKDVVHIYE